MGLMHLLNAGRSLSSVQDRPHRYKVKRGALPNFGNGDGAGRGGKSAVSGAGWGESILAKPPLPGSEAVKTETVVEEVARTPVAKVPSLKRWMPKGNPFKSLRAPQSPPPASVQGELRLDNVKPVRNDLSDSDLELVVATRREPVQSPISSQRPRSVLIESVEVPVVSEGSWWSRVGQFVQRVRGRG